ncbi:hypothetical protein PPGU19_095770 (plasmid) [Paraburkholderia sp. PGU19]|nr:hypothetical protein PPGU19_095770 [Paraburkholderia sp. PGU19]
MTLGQEFSTYAVMLKEDMSRLTEAAVLIREINLGATAIGTGITAHPEYAQTALKSLNRITGIELVTAPNLVEATQDCGAFVHVSSVLKRIAVKLSKICNDLRLLSSGPRAGFGEINLPPMQAGSSLMPGKVNPVIPEVVNQITFAAQGGQLQLNAFEPVIASALFRSFKHLTSGYLTLGEKCVNGITANHDRLGQNIEQSIALATALNPYIGYKASTSVAAEAHAKGRTIRQVVLRRQLLTEAQLEEALRHEALISPRACAASPDCIKTPHVGPRDAAPVDCEST